LTGDGVDSFALAVFVRFPVEPAPASAFAFFPLALCMVTAKTAFTLPRLNLRVLGYTV